MKKILLWTTTAVLCAGRVVVAQQKAAPAPQQQMEYNQKTWAPEDAQRIVQQVRHELLSLTNYGVFDSLSFSIQGKSIVLRGYASRPTLKSDAERAVKKIQGVASVVNQIKVLPNSPFSPSVLISSTIKSARVTLADGEKPLAEVPLIIPLEASTSIACRAHCAPPRSPKVL